MTGYILDIVSSAIGVILGIKIMNMLEECINGKFK